MHKASGWFAVILGLLTIIFIHTQMDYVVVVKNKSHLIQLTTATFPWLAGGGLLIFGCLLLICVHFKKITEKPMEITKKSYVTVPAVILSLSLYILFLDQVGYFIPTVVFVFIMSLFFGIRKPVALTSISLGVPLIIYFVFGKLLQVPFPGS